MVLEGICKVAGRKEAGELGDWEVHCEVGWALVVDAGGMLEGKGWRHAMGGIRAL